MTDATTYHCSTLVRGSKLDSHGRPDATRWRFAGHLPAAEAIEKAEALGLMTTRFARVEHEIVAPFVWERRPEFGRGGHAKPGHIAQYPVRPQRCIDRE